MPGLLGFIQFVTVSSNRSYIPHPISTYFTFLPHALKSSEIHENCPDIVNST